MQCRLIQVYAWCCPRLCTQAYFFHVVKSVHLGLRFCYSRRFIWVHVVYLPRWFIQVCIFWFGHVGALMFVFLFPTSVHSGSRFDVVHVCSCRFVFYFPVSAFSSVCLVKLVIYFCLANLVHSVSCFHFPHGFIQVCVFFVCHVSSFRFVCVFGYADLQFLFSVSEWSGVFFCLAKWVYADLRFC